MRCGAAFSARSIFLLLLLLILATAARADLWCTGYFPAWEQGAMPASAIDFTVVTHVIHFSLVPNSDGTLNSSDNGITPAYTSDVVSHAHAAGRKVLVCVGGASTESGFQGAASSANLAGFIKNLTNFMATGGYDGIDIDWEPLPVSDAMQYTNFIKGLRTAMNGFSQHKLLTVAAPAYPEYGDSPATYYGMFAAIQSQFDQINAMTYDLSGPYPGWVTWFNSPIYDGGYKFPSTGGLVPSIDGAVKNFTNNGVASGKLGIGIPFYGYVWSGGAGTSTGGVTQPRQSWTAAPTTTTPTYNEILSTYYQASLYHWDTAAQSAYLSVTNSSPANDEFISYDDPRACQSKVSYARNARLGGVMIWELAQDHQSGQADPLLQSIKQALAIPGATSIRRSGQNIQLSFTSAPLGSYSVQWTTNLPATSWTTLLTTNVATTGIVVQATDPTAIIGQSRRFYRVQTPP